MRISLFERLAKQGYPVCFLDTQYLINPSIAFFPSYKYYNTKLKSGVDPIQTPLLEGFNWPNPDIGIAVINVNQEEEVSNYSLQNFKEAEIVTQIIVSILTNGQVDISDIAVLTPYKAQQRLIKKALIVASKRYPSLFRGPNYIQESQSGVSALCVELVDYEKPIDKDLIIFSTVRSNKNGNLGELQDSRVLNSVLLKGRRGVICVGNLATLSHNEAMRDFIFWSQSNGIILNYNSNHTATPTGASQANNHKSS